MTEDALGGKGKLRDRELNPGLPRDRRRYLPLYYRGDTLRQPHLFAPHMHIHYSSSSSLLAPHSYLTAAATRQHTCHRFIPPLPCGRVATHLW